ncbi:hypothetical protein CHLRE_03g169900v5 [Chlamydomonas reinhardtii]|uniref:CR008 protein n=1 Tax=Chlamydomonas reinhardtii TaxID=3055 RepID=Q84X79_CHLRE|nr:uncharacterized protein CHLRE_03g169900v5 [Chlamydomonas reinhardtii]AAO32615.1 CR008 protein [Chlamydomonas reinhardtii]PNW85057.1 hypothetical protein CHLRE_03g169900v5 [Chlamydomonas reinhardtii]|eukprot:XP_001703492.1 CR008 protein [Chlamydomonas reinhardtii]
MQLRQCHLRGNTRTFGSARICQRKIVVARSGGQQGLGEDVLAKLRAAEEEAARLKAELAALQSAKGVPEDKVEKVEKVRIDSTDNRETLFGGGPRSAWLSEKDVEFFSGPAGVREEDASTLEPEYKATVTRRLLIGAALTAGAAAFALVPTEALRPKPSKPLYFYLVSLLRVQDLLVDCKSIIEDADWEQLRGALARIEGPPNNIRATLDAIIALIPDSRTAARVTELSADLYEYLKSLDYQQYFDSPLRAKANTGAQNAQYASFSLQSLQAAQGKLNELLTLVPKDQLQLARDQMAAGY